MVVFTEGYSFMHARFFPSWKPAVLLDRRGCRGYVHRKPHLCWPRIRAHVYLIFTYMSCKIFIIKFHFSTVIPDVDHMHIVAGTFPHGHSFAITCLVQPPVNCFLSQNNCLWFQITAAPIQRPTLSLAPALSGLFEDLLLKNCTPNAEQIVPFVVQT